MKLDALDHDILRKIPARKAARSLELATLARGYASGTSGMKRILRMMEIGLMEEASAVNIPIERLNQKAGFWVQLTPAGRVVRQLVVEIERGDYQ